MRNVSAQTRGEIEFIKGYLVKQYTIGNHPPDNVLEWQKRWFKNRIYPEVYHLLHTASIEVAKESMGRIQFRHNLIQDTWRFHEGLDDYLMIHFGTQQRIGGHMATQDMDYGFSSVLVPKIKDEIFLIDTPILNVGKKTVLQLKQKYKSS